MPSHSQEASVAVFHVVWVIVAIATSIAHSQRCDRAPPSQVDSAGSAKPAACMHTLAAILTLGCQMQVHYLVLGIGIFIIFVLSAAGEIALVWVGLLGEPFSAATCTCEALLALCSSEAGAGTPLEVKKRAAIPYLIYAVLALYVTELGFVSKGPPNMACWQFGLVPDDPCISEKGH